MAGFMFDSSISERRWRLLGCGIARQFVADFTSGQLEIISSQEELADLLLDVSLNRARIASILHEIWAIDGASNGVRERHLSIFDNIIFYAVRHYSEECQPASAIFQRIVLAWEYSCSLWNSRHKFTTADEVRRRLILTLLVGTEFLHGGVKEQSGKQIRDSLPAEAIGLADSAYNKKQWDVYPILCDMLDDYSLQLCLRARDLLPLPGNWVIDLILDKV